MLRSNSPGTDKSIKRAPCRRYSVAGGICVLQTWFSSLPCAAFQTIKSFCVCEVIFPLGDGSAGQGGRGDSDLPPYAPLDPLYPLQTAEGYPRTPLYRKGYVPLSLDRQGPYRALHLARPWASNQSGATTGTHFAWPRCRGACRCKVVLLLRPLADTPRIDRRPGAGGGISCAEGDSGPPGNGREPSWARPCEASGAL